MAVLASHIVHAQTWGHHHIVRRPVDVPLVSLLHLAVVLWRSVRTGYHTHGSGPGGLPRVGGPYSDRRGTANLGQHHTLGSHASHLSWHALLHALHAGVHPLPVLRHRTRLLLHLTSKLLLLGYSTKTIGLLLQVDGPIPLLLLSHHLLLLLLLCLLLLLLLLLHHGVALLLH